MRAPPRDWSCAMRLALVLAASLALAACKPGDDPPPDPQAAATPAPTILDDQRAALDKAQAVEGDVLEGKARTDAALDEAEGN